jgi:TonB-dependent receptor
MTAPSNGGVDGGRGFDFGLLPSELFTNVAVFKTGRARDAEGGLAGLIQLDTPEPLSTKGLNIAVSAQGDHSELAGETGSRTAFLINNNIDDVFGISAGLVYTSQQYQANQTGGFAIRPLSAILTSDAAANATPEQLAAKITNIQHYIHDAEDRDTLSANIGMQWRISDDVEVSFTGLYSDLSAERYYTRADAPSEGNVTGFSDLVVQDGLVRSATLSGVQQRLGVYDSSSEEELTILTTAVEWTPNENWKIVPFIGYSKRDVERVGNLFSFRRADLSTGEFVNADVNYTYRGDFVDWNTSGTDFSARPEEFLINVFLIRPTTDKDEDFTTKLDFVRSFDDGALSSINFGARYSDRELGRTGADLLVLADTDDRRTIPSLADAFVVLDNFQIDGAPSNVPSSILSVDPVRAVSIFAPNGFNGAPIDGVRFQNRPNVLASRSFDLKEQTVNAYVEFNFELDEFTFNAGLRYLRTEQIAGGFSITNDVPSPISIGNDYKELLPSFSGRYNITDDIVLRGAYSRSLTRAALGNLAPTEIVNGVDEGGGTGTQGNPNLMPFTADNLDFGLDYYFGDGGYVSANIFYKDIKDIIDTESFTEVRTFGRQKDDVLVTAPIVFTRPSNGATATIEGLELSGQLPFSEFSGGLLGNAGIIANYTFTNSDADFGTKGDARSSGLPGLSENSLNLVAYYDDGVFDTRLSYAWRSDYLEAFSGTYGIPRFEKSRGQLDFSASYQVIDNLSLQFQVLNLTNEQRVQTTTAEFRAPNNVRQLDRRYLFGARYTF